MHHVHITTKSTTTTENHTLSLHDALPICAISGWRMSKTVRCCLSAGRRRTKSEKFSQRSEDGALSLWARSEEHTSELQSHSDLVCRLLLEKKKIIISRDI